MKYSIIIWSILVFVLFGCQSKESTIKSTIKEYLSKNIADFKSYEPLTFSEPELINYSATTYGHKVLQPYFDTIELNIDSVAVNRCNKHIQKIDASESMKDLAEYSVLHSYRCNDLNGHPKIHYAIFRFSAFSEFKTTYCYSDLEK